MLLKRKQLVKLESTNPQTVHNSVAMPLDGIDAVIILNCTQQCCQSHIATCRGKHGSSQNAQTAPNIPVVVEQEFAQDVDGKDPQAALWKYEIIDWAHC